VTAVACPPKRPKLPSPILSMANYRIGRKRYGVTWSNNVTEGNGRLVFKSDLEFAMDRQCRRGESDLILDLVDRRHGAAASGPEW
jgi:hypothetical protein